jgi:hypothetical protein
VGRGRVSEVTCKASTPTLAKSLLGPLDTGLARSTTRNKYGFHLHRLAALTGRKRILLQLGGFFLCPVTACTHPLAFSCAQALIFGVQYVRTPNQAISTGSLTTEGFRKGRQLGITSCCPGRLEEG